MKRTIQQRACPIILGATLSLLIAPALAQTGASDPPEIAFSQVSHSANEGDAMTFVVKKNGDGEASVDYTTFSVGVDNQATANVDYEATSGTLTFFASDTEHTITVNTKADAEIAEAAETFGVRLSLPTGGDGGQASATLVYPVAAVGTILNCATPC